MPESSWTALAKGKERDWCSIDLEVDVERLKVVGPWSGTEGGSVDTKRMMNTGQLGQKLQEKKVKNRTRTK